MKRLAYINAIGEAIIPLAGLLFFEWGIYFIILFYFIDLIAAEVFSYLKVNKVIKQQGIKYSFQQKLLPLLANSALVLLIIFLSHVAVYFIVPGISFQQEFIAFLNYEEAGLPIPQGYILLPLVVLGNFQHYKLTFIKTGLFRVTSWSKLISQRRKTLFIAILGALLGIVIAYFLPLPEFIYVLVIVALKFYVDIAFSELH